jgi:hypothetical protein
LDKAKEATDEVLESAEGNAKGAGEAVPAPPDEKAQPQAETPSDPNAPRDM